MKHTPTPYRYFPSKAGRSDWIEDADGSIVVESVGYLDGPFIVRACNAHYDLVEALEMLLQDCKEKGQSASYRQAESALKLARGE